MIGAIRCFAVFSFLLGGEIYLYIYIKEHELSEKITNEIPNVSILGVWIVIKHMQITMKGTASMRVN